MFAQMRVLLFVITILMVGGVAVAEEFKFRSGDIQKIEIKSWMRYGVLVDADIGQPRFYFYVEIESIDGRAIEKLGIYKALMVLWSSVKDWVASPHIGTRKEMRIYDQDNELIKNRRKVCKDAKGSEVINLYNREKVLQAKITCARRKRKNSKSYYGNGSLQCILIFKNNDLAGVERYTQAGDQLLLGNTIGSQ